MLDYCKVSNTHTTPIKFYQKQVFSEILNVGPKVNLIIKWTQFGGRHQESHVIKMLLVATG